MARQSLSENGIILIDDYDFLQTVKLACDEFKNKSGMTMMYLPSARGGLCFCKMKILNLHYIDKGNTGIMIG